MKKSRGIFLLLSLLVVFSVNIYTVQARTNIKYFNTSCKAHKGKNHSYVIDKSRGNVASCKSPGKLYYKCNKPNCRAYYVVSSPKLREHVFTNRGKVIKHPTCKRTGCYILFCTVCHKGKKCTFDKLPHDYVSKDGKLVCKMCGKIGDNVFSD